MGNEFEEQAKKLMDVRTLVMTSIVTALSFVVGLFWRDAIQETINLVLPEGQGLGVKYAAAIIATLFVVLVAWLLLKSYKTSMMYVERALVENKKLKNKLSQKKITKTN